MKQLLLVISLFVFQLSLAQNVQVIENKLSKAFFKIKYWSAYNSSYDSLEKANHQFEQLLLNYTSKKPETVNAQFKSLKDSSLVISTSDDGNFRIYSWDTWMGGTMHFYRTVFQYKINGHVYSKTFTNPKEEDRDPDCLYYAIHQVTSNNKNFYLTFSSARLSSGLFDLKIKVFSIDDSNLNENARLIKTKTGIKNQLGYEVDLTSAANRNKEVPDFNIEYDNVNKIISIPVILENNEVTKRRIQYQFTGKFFEKI
jgi:hypothetical protein